MAKLSNDRLDKFRPQTRNANKHTQRGMGALEAAMRKYGYVAPMTAAADGEILDGSARIETSANVFGDDVIVVHHDGTKPVIMVRDDIPHGDTPQAREISIAANRIAQFNLDFDPEVILGDLQAGVDLEQFWRKDELDELLADLQPKATEGDTPAEIDRAEAEKLAEQYGVRSRQVWQLGRHRIAAIDSLDAVAVGDLLGGAVPTFIWSDPPYGADVVSDGGTVGGGNLAPVGRYAKVIGDETTDTAKASAAKCLAAWPSAVQVWWGANYYASGLPDFCGWVVWDKTGDVISNNFADGELAWTNQDFPLRIYKQMWRGMIKEGESGKRFHPTQKPVGLAQWAFDKFGRAGDVILDPFLGSGISVLAAEALNDGRAVYGCELSLPYIAVVIHRWEGVTGNKAQCLTR